MANSSLLARDFAAGQLPAGPQGPRGPAGFSELTYHDNGDGGQVVPSGGGLPSQPPLEVLCPRGSEATGGAAVAFSTSTNADVTNQVVKSQFFASPSLGPFGEGWLANVTNNTGGDVRVFVRAACVTVGPPLGG